LRIRKVVGIVDRGAFVIGIVIVQFDDLVLADGFGIGDCGADRSGMQGIGIVLIEDLRAVEPEELIDGIVISVSAVVIDRPVQVDGKGPRGFF